jgi:hypothetical protein
MILLSEPVIELNQLASVSRDSSDEHSMPHAREPDRIRFLVNMPGVNERFVRQSSKTSLYHSCQEHIPS